MKSKSFITFVIAIIISLFSFSYTFASNNTMSNIGNGIRNTVNGAGNVIENTVQGGMNLIGNGTRNMDNTTGNTASTMTTNNGNNGDNGGYTATRTTTRMATADDATNGISTTTYTWVIIGVTAVAIGILLWSFFAQKKQNDLYIDSNNK